MPTAPAPLTLLDFDFFPRTTSRTPPRKGQLVYRVYGGKAGLYGGSWAPVDPTGLGPDDFRVVAGLPDRGNDGTHIVVGLLTSTEGVEVRGAWPVSPNMNWNGGPGGASHRFYPGGLLEYTFRDSMRKVALLRIVQPTRPYGGPPRGCTPAPVGCVGELGPGGAPWAGPGGA